MTMLGQKDEARLEAVKQYKAGMAKLATQIETLVQVIPQNEVGIATLQNPKPDADEYDEEDC